jgi:hypothetical protein
MELLRFPGRLVHADWVVLVLLASRFLPLATHAFAGPYCVVRRAEFGTLDRHALTRLSSGTQDPPTRGADLREPMLGEDAFCELHARVVIAPRPELRLTQSVDPHRAAVTQPFGRSQENRTLALTFAFRDEQRGALSNGPIPAWVRQ